MSHSPRLILAFVLLLTLGVIHLLALEHTWYWVFPWFDIPVHFAAGVIVALGLLALVDLKIPYAHRYASFVPVILGVVLVGMLWEVFEIWAGIPLIEDDFEADIVSDLVLDIAGGITGYIIGTYLIQRSS